jgi:transcription antitermination protein NusB
VNNLPEFDPSDEITSEVIEHDEAATERSLARRIALQVLYEVDSAGHKVGDVINAHMNVQEMSKKTSSYLRRLVIGVVMNQARLDTILQEYAPEWPLDQVAIVDRNILRMAIYELVFQARTPVGVAIDEAVALARLFGADGAARFVNGVLGAMAEAVRTLRQDLESADENGDGE